MNSKTPSTARKGRPSEAGSQRDLRRRTSASPERLGALGLSTLRSAHVADWYWQATPLQLGSGGQWGITEANDFRDMIRNTPLMEP